MTKTTKYQQTGQYIFSFSSICYGYSKRPFRVLFIYYYFSVLALNVHIYVKKYEHMVVTSDVKSVVPYINQKVRCVKIIVYNESMIVY